MAYEVPAGTTKAQVQALAANQMANPRIAKLLKKIDENDSELTLQTHLSRLSQLSLAAQRDGHYAAAVAAEVSRGKAAGLYGSAAATDEATPERIEEVMRALAERLPG